MAVFTRGHQRIMNTSKTAALGYALLQAEQQESKPIERRDVPEQHRSRNGHDSAEENTLEKRGR